MKKQGLGKGLSALLAEMGGDEAAAEEAPKKAASSSTRARRPERSRASTRGPRAEADGARRDGDSEGEDERRAEVTGVAELALDVIAPAPGQPRVTFDDAGLQELADSIGAKGVLQPILVRPLDGGGYQIIAGERRWRASRMAGRDTIPALVRTLSDVDSFEVALIENVQRQDLDPVEEAGGYQKLIRSFGHTQEMIASLTGKSRSHIANLLRLLDLPDDVLELLRAGELSVGHAKAILRAPEPSALAADVVARGLSVRQTERLAKGRPTKRATPTRPREVNPDPDIAALEFQLSDAVGVDVKVENRGAAGTVTIAYENLHQLDRIVSLLQA